MLKISNFMTKLLIFLIFTLVNVSLFSQNNGNYKESFINRVVLGGNLGLQFGSTTFIDISPTIGYKITPKFIAGVGVTYQYYRDKSVTPDYFTSIYGGRTFLTYHIYENLFAHIEYEHLRYQAYILPSYDKDWVGVNSYLVGGGYTQKISPNLGVAITILYNLNETVYSFYSNPIIRVGFSANL